MIKFLLARLQQGHRTAKFPDEEPTLPDRFRGRPILDASKCADGCKACVDACPTDALSSDGKFNIDLGRCLFCTDCAQACPEGAVSYSTDYCLSARTREGLILTGNAHTKMEALGEELRSMFGRSLKLRVVSAGGCNGCEADVNVLGTVVFDLGRFGIQYVASPRHADGLLITGPVTENMKLALKKTYDAVPDPKIVIAVGACAISGGPYIGHAEQHDGAGSVVPVDMFVPGCPPHPYTILDGLLSLLGRRRQSAARDRAEIVGELVEAETVLWGQRRANEAAELFGVGGEAGPKKTDLH
jgi:Ni,Fe-hydrogenase III small subunit/formate hydrogenlyase subunit 6/NADH:ubiquinone oxidoreductase subunit I